MPEIITIYKMTEPGKAIPMDRNKFYAEQVDLSDRNKEPTKACEVVQVLLFTPDKEIILQKRSSEKKHNAGLIDKSMGGHVLFGYTPTFTVMAETLQELHVPSFVLDSKEDFKETFSLLKNYLDRSALVQFIDSQIDVFDKMIDGKAIRIANKYDFYLGVYHGSIKPVDKEASGVLYYKLETLQDEIKKTPKIFTSDLAFFLKKYEVKISDFLKTIDINNY